MYVKILQQNFIKYSGIEVNLEGVGEGDQNVFFAKYTVLLPFSQLNKS